MLAFLGTRTGDTTGDTDDTAAGLGNIQADFDSAGFKCECEALTLVIVSERSVLADFADSVTTASVDAHSTVDSDDCKLVISVFLITTLGLDNMSADVIVFFCRACSFCTVFCSTLAVLAVLGTDLFPGFAVFFGLALLDVTLKSLSSLSGSKSDSDGDASESKQNRIWL